MTSHDQASPVWIFGADRPGRWLVTVDHATNTVPVRVAEGNLGLPARDMERHIAFDIGALGVARALGEHLNSPVIAANFSRLVIDPNRGEDDPTLIMKIYDGTIIPGNRHVDEAERETRLNTLYRPYHGAYAQLAARRPDTVICAVHSFTPQLRGRPLRPWEVGILHAHDARLSDHFLAQLATEQDLTVGRNEPYVGHLPGDAVDRHGLAHGRHNTLIELRQDLIETDDDQALWAARLAPHLISALETADARD